MIPVQVLASDFSVFKLDDADDTNLDTFAGRPHTWNHPVHDLIMRKLIDRLFGENIFSNDLRDGYGPDVSRVLSEKAIVVILVKSSGPLPPVATGTIKTWGLSDMVVSTVLASFITNSE
jgi:hypothetical protein